MTQPNELFFVIEKANPDCSGRCYFRNMDVLLRTADGKILEVGHTYLPKDWLEEPLKGADYCAFVDMPWDVKHYVHTVYGAVKSILGPTCWTYLWVDPLA